MNEKTLLLGALTATAFAAALGIWRTHETSARSLSIAPVTRLEMARMGRPVEVPVRLTSSDGTGLRLLSLRASAAIDDPLALTELHLVFENPLDRELEGTFEVTLPARASVSRFAMKAGDAWLEGEVVEKQRARAAYEDFLHQRQDPALLEQSGGNQFSARVFPIPARGTKEIILAYVETLEAGAAYVLPLKGLPSLGALDVDVHAAGAVGASFGLHQVSITPAQDFEVDARSLPRSAGLRSGELVVARVVPFASSRPDPLESAIVLVDTSASRALGIAEQTRLLQRVLAKLRPEARVTVACFDQEIVPIYEGAAAGFGDKDAAAILDRGALGASDFERALAWAGQEATKRQVRRIVIVGDGVATAGETDAQQIKRQVEKLRAARVERIDAIAVGGIRDDAFLRSLVRGVLDKDGVVLDAAIGPEGLARRLGESTLSGVPVTVEGASWSWPKTIDGLQAGDELMVYAEVPPGTSARFDVGGQQFTPDLRTTERPLLERAWAQAKIQSLAESPTEDASATKKAIIALSTRHRVVSAHTAMLVLEADADYARFGIDRNATADILSVSDGRVAVLRPSGAKFRSSATRTDSVESDASPETRRESANKDVKKEEKPAVVSAVTTPTDEPPSARPADGERTKGLAPSPPPPPRFAAPAPTPTPAPRPNQPVRQRPATTETAGPLLAGATKDATKPNGAEDRKVQPRLDEAPAGGKRQDGRADPANGVTLASSATLRAPSVPKTADKAGADEDGVSLLLKTDSKNDPSSTAEKQIFAAPVASGSATPPTPSVAHGAAPSLSASAAPPTQSADNNEIGDDGVTRQQNREPRPAATPYEGRMKVVMDRLARGDKRAALAEAIRWHAEEPGDVMALVALGEALEANGDVRTAARAYGSILELHPFRADSRRFAGERLERLRDAAALELAIDSYGKAVAQRPDHPSSHRLHAFALLKHGEHEKAFVALRAGTLRTYPEGRFLGAGEILREDLGLVAAAWGRAEPRRAQEIHTMLRDAGGREETEPSLRFVLVWESDANDVDFHIYDGRGDHAFFSQPALPSGGKLYADVTTGYGPECFTIRGAPDRRAYPYALSAHYFARGPMGYGMGKLELIEHDGKGNLVFEDRPYVVMSDEAHVDLGRVDRKTPRKASAMK